MIEAIEQDLLRFLPPEILDVHRNEGFAGFLDAIRSLFTDLKEKGGLLS